MADARKTLYCFWEKRYSGIAGSFSFLFFSFIFILFIFFFRGEGGQGRIFLNCLCLRGGRVVANAFSIYLRRTRIVRSGNENLSFHPFTGVVGGYLILNTKIFFRKIDLSYLFHVFLANIYLVFSSLVFCFVFFFI